MITHAYYNKEAFDELVEVIAKTDKVNRKLKKAGLRIAQFKMEREYSSISVSDIDEEYRK